MDRKLITAAGAAAVLATVPASAGAAALQEAPIVPAAQSYAELLEPITNASDRLRVSDAQAAARRPALQRVQYDQDNNARHDHHHHHHHHSNDWYAQNGYTFFGGRWESPQEYAHHHHHHHHHHHSQDNDNR